MANYGFVYILTNAALIGMFKAGCSERSPTQRACELSAPTGVPMPFEVFCYAEFEDFQTIEKRLHEFIKQWRVSANREFFYSDALTNAVGFLYRHPKKLAFARLYAIEDELGVERLSDLYNPWAKAKEAVEVAEASAQGELSDKSNVVNIAAKAL